MQRTVLALAASVALAGTAFAQSSAGSPAGSGGDTRLMQKQAEADYKSAKAQCETKEGQQKTLCLKVAAVSYAQAELAVEQARPAGDDGQMQPTSAMGGSRPSWIGNSYDSGQ